MAEKPLTNSINALTEYINEVTGEADDNLSDAISTLAEGYGGGGYSADDLANKSKPSGAITFNTATKIYSKTFIERYGITSIDSTTVIDIETEAFKNNTGLKTVNLPELKTVTGSTGGMFSGCTKLTTFIAPKLTNIQQNMFNSCSVLTSVDFRSVKTISAQGFSGCSKLSRLCFPRCSSIAVRAFNGCTSLTDIYLPNDESTYTNAPWNAPSTCTIHYNTVFDENGEPVIE